MSPAVARFLGALIAAWLLLAAAAAGAEAAQDIPVEPGTEVVHGQITDSGGRGIQGAWVVVYQLEDGRNPVRAVTRTDASGAYRITLRLPASTVFVRVALRFSGGVHTASNQLLVEPGHAYQVSAQLQPQQGFVFLTPPAAPTIAAVKVDDAAVTVDWTPPQADGGADITAYRVRVVEADSGDVVRTVTVPATKTDATVTGLAAGTPYTVEVSAENPIGTGPAARSAEIVPPLDPHALLAAVATGPGAADLASRGESGALLVRPWTATAGLGPITDLGGSVVGAPAITGRGESREVFVRGSDNALWLRSRASPAAAWSDWASLGGGLRGGPAAAALPNGDTIVAGRGTDGGLWVRERSPDGRWTGWSPLRGGIPDGAGPALAVTAADRVDLVVRGTESALWHRARTGSGSAARWTGWASLGGRLLGDPALAGDGYGRAVAVVRGTNDAAYGRDLVGGGPVSGWVSMGGSLASSPVAIQGGAATGSTCWQTTPTAR